MLLVTQIPILTFSAVKFLCAQIRVGFIFSNRIDFPVYLVKSVIRKLFQSFLKL